MQEILVKTSKNLQVKPFDFFMDQEKFDKCFAEAFLEVCYTQKLDVIDNHAFAWRQENDKPI